MGSLLVVSRLSEAELGSSYVTSHGRGLGARGMWSAADKEALDQNFMNENKRPLIFPGNMFVNMLVIVHVTSQVLAKNQTRRYLGSDLFSEKDGTWLYTLRRILGEKSFKIFFY